MNILSNFKIIVVIISFTMFCYQLIIATNNLIDPPTVDSTYEREIAQVDLPIITICPTRQTNDTRLSEFKYMHGLGSLLYGSIKCNETTACTSWGAHLNLTFDELLREIFDLEKVNSVLIYAKEIEDSLVFIPRYGLCKEILNFDMNQQIIMEFNKPDMARVLITDRNYRSYFMPDITSHRGSKTFMKPNQTLYINVKIQVQSHCKNDEKPLKEIEFRKCIEKKILSDFEQLECIPPWLNGKNQCIENYYNFDGNSFSDAYVNPVLRLNNIMIEDDCKKSCKETKYIVTEGEIQEYSTSEAVIAFKKKLL